MGWLITDSDGSGTAWQAVVRKRVAGAPVSFPDRWWDPQFWASLQKAGAYAEEIDAIAKKLPDPPDAAETEKELEAILAHRKAADFAERVPEIIEEHEAPPPYYRRMLWADKARNAQTGALLSTTVSWSVPFIMALKLKWRRARPGQLEPRIRPVVDVPGHPAYPSGHSTQAHLVALVMGAVTGRKDFESALWDAADRIAENREYAGLHYASDSACGASLAQELAPLFLAEHKAQVQKAHEEEWA